MWFMWNKQKEKSICYTWTESGPKNVSRPNQSDAGLERSRTRTWTCTNTNTWSLLNHFWIGQSRCLANQLFVNAHNSRLWSTQSTQNLKWIAITFFCVLPLWRINILIAAQCWRWCTQMVGNLSNQSTWLNEKQSYFIQCWILPHNDATN